MSLRVTLRALVCCLALFALSGCAASPVEENAECSQGATRVEKCGLYGVGLQQQVCGPRYRWINEGSCVEQTVCEHRETRREPCGGLNDTAYREQRCDLGQWPETWGPCEDPDVCVNGTEDVEDCNSGINGNATRELLCEDGQWAPQTECVDLDTCMHGSGAETGCDDNAFCAPREEGAVCECFDGFLGDGLECEDIDECADSQVHDCPVDSLCVNTPGSFRCECPPGMIDVNRDGKECVGVKAVASGRDHTCAITADSVFTDEWDIETVLGSLFCWGANDKGQLGVPTIGTQPQLRPIQVGDASDWNLLEAGGDYARAVNFGGDNELWHWGGGPKIEGGYDSGWELSHYNIMMRSVSRLSVGDMHTCVVNGFGQLVCWGTNQNYQLGSGDGNALVEQVGTGSDWTKVGVGANHSCAINTQGQLYCWGSNSKRQLANGLVGGGYPFSQTEVPNPNTDKWLGVTGGAEHTCAWQINNAYCWGDNASGQVGSGGSGIFHIAPEAVSLPGARIVMMSAGSNHTCAITGSSVLSKSGELRCWGSNAKGQIGVEAEVDTLTPTRVGTASNWVQVYAGDEHTCAVNDEDRLFCWGANDQGQLGNGTTTSVNEPTPL